jgi:multiple sugar transport system substrate-binding protein
MPGADGPLRVALVGGPMYDHLYTVFADHGIEVEVVVHADHPTLNRRVAELLHAGERIDILATHSKYAPSQAQWLRPLDELIDRAAVEELASRAVELCRSPDGAAQLCLPRLVDVRVLWARIDRVDVADLDSWDALVRSSTVFGFTGRESGLFGTFFELVAGNGGRLFDDDQRPAIDCEVAIDAIDRLVRLGRRIGPEVADWHYDDVDRALLDGHVDAAAAWPGGWGAIRASPLVDVLEPLPYPAGPTRRVSYSGCHAWAIPTTCGDVGAAAAAVHLLIGHDAQHRDALGGSFCAHRSALAAVDAEGELDARRRAITAATIDESMITYPSLSWFPAVEDAGWQSIREAILGHLGPADAARRIQALATDAMR